MLTRDCGICNKYWVAEFFLVLSIFIVNVSQVTGNSLNEKVLCLLRHVASLSIDLYTQNNSSCLKAARE